MFAPVQPRKTAFVFNKLQTRRLSAELFMSTFDSGLDEQKMLSLQIHSRTHGMTGLKKLLRGEITV